MLFSLYTLLTFSIYIYKICWLQSSNLRLKEEKVKRSSGVIWTFA